MTDLNNNQQKKFMTDLNNTDSKQMILKQMQASEEIRDKIWYTKKLTIYLNQNKTKKKEIRGTHKNTQKCTKIKIESTTKDKKSQNKFCIKRKQNKQFRGIDGGLLLNISNDNIPKAHQLTLNECYLFNNISGAIYSGVPHNVHVLYGLSNLFAKPKSVNVNNHQYQLINFLVLNLYTIRL